MMGFYRTFFEDFSLADMLFGAMVKKHSLVNIWSTYWNPTLPNERLAQEIILATASVAVQNKKRQTVECLIERFKI